MIQIYYIFIVFACYCCCNTDNSPLWDNKGISYLSLNNFRPGFSQYLEFTVFSRLIVSPGCFTWFVFYPLYNFLAFVIWQLPLICSSCSLKKQCELYIFIVLILSIPFINYVYLNNVTYYSCSCPLATIS